MQRVQPTWAWARRLSIPIGSPRASEEGAGTWTRCCFCFFLSAFLPSTLLPSARYAQTRLARIIVAVLPSNPSDVPVSVPVCLSQLANANGATLHHGGTPSRMLSKFPRTCVASSHLYLYPTVYYSLALLAPSPRHTPHVVQGATDATEATEEQPEPCGAATKAVSPTATLPPCLTVPKCLVCCCHWRAPSILLSPVHGSPAAPASSLCSLAHTCSHLHNLMYRTLLYLVRMH
jgi:hypothetical protein